MTFPEEFLKNFLGNYWFWSAFSAWFLSQMLKLFTGVFKEKKRTASAIIFGSGGMPSAHTATAVALTTALLMTEGIGSPLPILSGVLAIVIMTDAASVRLEVGRHSRFLNRMVDENREEPPKEGHFRTILGHTVAQIAVGAAIGIASALLLFLIPAVRA